MSVCYLGSSLLSKGLQPSAYRRWRGPHVTTGPRAQRSFQGFWKDFTWLPLVINAEQHVREVLSTSDTMPSHKAPSAGEPVLESVNYKWVLAKGICRLPLWRLTPVLLQLLAHLREFRVESEALCAPGKLVEQVLRQFSGTDIFRILKYF